MSQAGRRAAESGPATRLVDQQQVRISVSGFPFSPDGESRISVIQCAAEATDSAGCGDFTGIAPFYDETGPLTIHYRASRTVRTPAFGTIDCATTPQRCVIVVSTLDLSQLFVVLISFDPAVSPLPPVDIDAALGPSARVNPRSGVVALSGSVSCTVPTPIRGIGSVGQQQSEMQIFGFVDVIVRCSGTERWSARVRSSTPGTVACSPLTSTFPGPETGSRSPPSPTRSSLTHSTGQAAEPRGAGQAPPRRDLQDRSHGPEAYDMFQKKHDGAVKILLHP
jgi:hypothetical protein